MAKAKTRLSDKAKMVKYGYGQVEGNKLSARYNGGIFAQLPAASTLKVLENGMFAKYDYAKGVVDLEKDAGEWMLVFNEVKVYENGQTDADFAMINTNYDAKVYSAVADGSYSHQLRGETILEYDGGRDAATYGLGGMMPEGTVMVPRLLQTRPGDIFTTNCIKTTKGPEETEFEETMKTELKVGTKLHVDIDGYLTTGAPEEGMCWAVVKYYTMPDGQPGVKIMRLPDVVKASEASEAV